MVTLTVDNQVDFTNIYVGKHRKACFTFDHEFGVWGSAPEDNRPTWERLCKMAGLDPDNAEDALNAALKLVDG